MFIWVLSSWKPQVIDLENTVIPVYHVNLILTINQHHVPENTLEVHFISVSLLKACTGSRTEDNKMVRKNKSSCSLDATPVFKLKNIIHFKNMINTITFLGMLNGRDIPHYFGKPETEIFTNGRPKDCIIKLETIYTREDITMILNAKIVITVLVLSHYNEKTNRF